MKTFVHSLALLCLILSTSIAGPKINPTSTVSIRDSQFAVVRVLHDPADIAILVSGFRRATKVGVSSDRKAFSHKIDIESRWLYDAQKGEFMLLSKAEQSVYRLSDSDRTLVNALIEKEGPNQAPEPTRASAGLRIEPQGRVAHL